MNQKLRLLMMTLLCAVVSVAWGQITIATATFDGKNGNYTEGWTTTGTGKGRTDCIIIGAGENITSPSFNLSSYSKVSITFTGRRYGTLSNSKATVDVAIAGSSMGTIDITNGSVGPVSSYIDFKPTSAMTAAKLVFTCTNATSAGSTHGAGIGSITIKGTTATGETVEIPTFSLASGTYIGEQTVSISCATSGATIYYTIGGATPSSNSSVYSSPITISETTTLKAIAIKNGVSSDVASANYTIEEPIEGTIIASGEFNGKEEKYPQGWTTNGTGKTRTDCIIIGKDENITSPTNPTFDFSHYSKIIITIKARRSGSLSGSKAIIAATLNGSMVGTTEASSTDAKTRLTTIEFTPTYSMTAAVLVFTCTNATSAGSTHGAGINSITISGVEGVPGVDTPTFSLAEGTYTEEQTVSISCATTDATIYYTTDGTEPSANSSVYSTPITISETTTLKAIAIKNNVSSPIASATYTIPKPITIAAARTQATGSVFTQGIVTSCVGRTAYIQDETAGICVYGNQDLNLTVGDKIKVQGTLTTYNGLLEITNPTFTFVSSDNTVVPIVKTIAEISNDIQGMLVKIENATVTDIDNQNTTTNTTIKQGEYSIIVRGITGVEYAVNDIISLTGNVGCYNTVQIVNPSNITVTQIPTITVSTTSINVPATESEGTIEVTFTNVDSDADIVFYEADGTTEATYNWIIAEINGNNIEYAIEANNGEARTAYFKVYALDNNANDVYSELITVTQAAPVLDYASLPFEFNGGKSDIEDSNGLTCDGLGNDYSQTQDPTAPKLKFDSTGDYLILKINEDPSAYTLLFDIKLNGSSFNNSTFTVQASEDGTTYSNLKTFTETELTGSTQNEVISNLGENIRYIKWIYTTKGSGNIGIGNIKLKKHFTLTISSAATDGKGSYYATMSAIGNGNFKVPEGVVASAITLNDNKKITQTAVFEGGKEREDVLPGDGAYLIEVKDATKSYIFTPTAEEAFPKDFENWLYPATKDVYVTAPEGYTDEEYKFYQLSLDSNHTPGSVGFYYGPDSASGDEGGQPFKFGSDHKAYLAVPRNLRTSASISLFDGIEDTDGINGITASERSERGVYTLTGVRVDNKNLPKGIYIVNGKKQVVK